MTIGVLALVMVMEKALSYRSIDWQFETKAAETCISNPPLVQIFNSYAWSDWGTWAKSGQTVPFAVQISNTDSSGCGATTFEIRPQLPKGFLQQPTSTTVKLQPGAKSTIQTVYITSPIGTLNGDYPIDQIAWRSNSLTGTGRETSWYKVYSTDISAPVFSSINPADGQTVSGNAVLIANARDDHMVRKIELYIDGRLTATNTNDGVTYTNSLVYNWDTGRLNGEHNVTYKAVDDFGNTASKTVKYTVK